MWLFTPFGFYSIVRKDGGGELTVRARARADLSHLRRRYLPALSATVVKPRSDYRYHAKVKKSALAAALRRIVEDIDYPNFKDEVRRVGGAEREELCHRVWEVMLEATELEQRSRAQRES